MLVAALNGLLRSVNKTQQYTRVQSPDMVIQQYQVPVSMVLALHFLPVVPIKSIWEEQTLVKPVQVVLLESMVELQEQSMGQ